MCLENAHSGQLHHSAGMVEPGWLLRIETRSHSHRGAQPILERLQRKAAQHEPDAEDSSVRSGKLSKRLRHEPPPEATASSDAVRGTAAEIAVFWIVPRTSHKPTGRGDAPDCKILGGGTRM